MNRLDPIAVCVLTTGIAVVVRAQEPDWSSMSYTLHSAYQSVDPSGNGAFATDHPTKMRGILLNWPTTMLSTMPGSDPFMGGQWQRFFQAADVGDFGGTALWMGQNIGKVMGNHPAGSYTDEQWLAELDRLSHDPVTGRLFRPGILCIVVSLILGVTVHPGFTLAGALVWLVMVLTGNALCCSGSSCSIRRET